MRRLLPIFCMVAGCGSANELMPMAPGQEWTYSIRSGFRTYVEAVKVVRETSIDGGQGFELGGPTGPCTLGWVGGRLLARQVAGNRFDPPLPLLVSGSKNWSWQGTVRGLKGVLKATASGVSSDERLDLGGRTFATTKSVIEFELADSRVELSTWFSRGVGIVRQEQRTNGRQDIALELLSGP